MPNKRYSLPQLGFIQGFEAAARNLSFTKAAEELFITQSAISRQVKALEDHLGVSLFERRQRALALTESGQALYRVATDVLERLQATADQLRAAGHHPLFFDGNRERDDLALEVETLRSRSSRAGDVGWF